ncbi:D-alanyl-D-alanine carboxypeptidase, partial [bacterium]|nr:D-alanyl-D-alanine carboxypeptidase [bacterium]
PTGVISSLHEGANENITVNRYNWNNPELIEISGNMNGLKPVMVPVSSMRRYFIHSVAKALEDNKIVIKNSSFSSKLVPDNAQLVTQVANPVTQALPDALKKSDNLIAETLFKVSAGKYYMATGSDELGVRAFQDFYSKKGVKFDDVILVEGSGVSRNDLITADWMTEALSKIYKADNFDAFKEYIAQPGDGTLKDRLLDLRGEAYLKTGSLANVSALAGYVYSKDGNVYSVCILVKNFKQKAKDVKAFENEIINYIYSK